MFILNQLNKPPNYTGPFEKEININKNKKNKDQINNIMKKQFEMRINLSDVEIKRFEGSFGQLFSRALSKAVAAFD